MRVLTVQIYHRTFFRGCSETLLTCFCFLDSSFFTKFNISWSTGFSWTGRFVNGIWYPFTIDKTSWWRIILFYCFTNWDSLPASGTFGISSVNNFLSTGCIKVIDASGTSFELLMKGTYFRFSEKVFTLWF